MAVCPTCGRADQIDDIKVPRDERGRVQWTPEFIEAVEEQHAKGGRSYKWIAVQLGLNEKSLSVALYFRHKKRQKPKANGGANGGPQITADDAAAMAQGGGRRNGRGASESR